MKKINLGLLLFAACVWAYSCQQVTADQAAVVSAAPLDETAETEAILQVIERETDCFFKRDYECWKGTYVTENYAFQAWTNPDGTFNARVGWKEIDEKISKYMKDYPVPVRVSRDSKVERKNMQVNFLSNQIAYMIWDQYHLSLDSTLYRHSKETRIMEKKDGAWKIVNLTALWDYKNTIAADSLNL